MRICGVNVDIACILKIQPQVCTPFKLTQAKRRLPSLEYQNNLHEIDTVGAHVITGHTHESLRTLASEGPQGWWKCHEFKRDASPSSAPWLHI